MNNIELIAQAAIESGIYTKEQAEEIIEQNGCLPLHTFAFWKNRYGMVPKKGEHAILTTRLWKQRKQKNKNQEEENPNEDACSDYFLAKAFLFSYNQLEQENKEEGEIG